MSRKSRMQSLQQAKDRRMKKIAAGGAVLLAVVLAFEVPKVLNSGGSSTPPAATTTASATAPSATPAAAAVTPTASTKLANSDAAPERSKSELYSFSRFAGKDPFVQQIGSKPQGAAANQTTAARTGPGSARGGNGAGSGAAQGSSARTLAVSGAAKIQVNGTLETVRVGASFPSANPLFQLVSVGAGVAKIGIANGSYASGAQTVSLAAGRSVTLVDTADGARYTIRLVSAS
jgi:hypothetical protein